MDAALMEMRAAGMSWDGICKRLKVSRWAVIQRGKKVGAEMPAQAEEPGEPGRSADPLPAGHPITWGAITDGTVLHGVPYPLAPSVQCRISADLLRQAA
jgi:hypothetical protein